MMMMMKGEYERRGEGIVEGQLRSFYVSLPWLHVKWLLDGDT